MRNIESCEDVSYARLTEKSTGEEHYVYILRKTSSHWLVRPTKLQLGTMFYLELQDNPRFYIKELPHGTQI